MMPSFGGDFAGILFSLLSARCYGRIVGFAVGQRGVLSI